jgi:F-type H+-transporting ATPase subunit alpha
VEKIAGGDWEDSTVEAVDDAVAEFADDFGYDLDEEGQPMEEGESERVAKRDGDGGESAADAEASENGEDDEKASEEEAEEKKETAGAR